MLLGYTRTPLAAMAGGHISYNPAVRFANLRTLAGPFAAWLRPARALPFLLIRTPGLESLNLSDGLPLELF